LPFLTRHLFKLRKCGIARYSTGERQDLLSFS
jgi:hypothetical protein